MSDFADLAAEIAPQRLSDIFLPRPPLASCLSEHLKFTFDSTKSGRREREATLHAINISNEGEIIFECMCHESESMKSFRMTNIASDIECGGKSYTPEDFIVECIGIPFAECQLAVRKAYFYTRLREDFDKLIGQALEGKAPVWTGDCKTAFKYGKKTHDLNLKNIFLIGADDYYLFGYSNAAGRFLFVPYAAIEGAIALNGKKGQKKTFLRNFGLY